MTAMNVANAATPKPMQNLLSGRSGSVSSGRFIFFFNVKDLPRWTAARRLRQQPLVTDGRVGGWLGVFKDSTIDRARELLAN
jgi:hypothetical protein